MALLDLVLESEVGVLEGRRYAARLKMAGLPVRPFIGPAWVRPSARASGNDAGPMRPNTQAVISIGSRPRVE